ncbi:MAG: efflux RND transporter periplasmic adaptor subunit [Verrucomicrobia bacterium]|nr:efflux RND transporter periplasmic adaptor subunit [Verrucomicrobiota bacterium]
MLAMMLAAGCGAPKDTPEPAEEAGEASALFHPGRGLRLTLENRQGLGIETGGASPQTLHPVVNGTAQVFDRITNRAGIPIARASVLLPAAPHAFRAGQRVWLGPPRNSGPAATGAVTRVEATLRPALDQVEALFETPDPSGCFPPGSFVPARLPVGTRAVPVAVPAAAVVRAALGDFVYRVEGDYFKRVPVSVGAEDGTWVEITRGLLAGERLATGGATALWLLELSEVGGMTNLE